MPTATQMTSMVARQYLTLETAKTASRPLSLPVGHHSVLIFLTPSRLLGRLLVSSPAPKSSSAVRLAAYPARACWNRSLVYRHSIRLVRHLLARGLFTTARQLYFAIAAKGFLLLRKFVPSVRTKVQGELDKVTLELEAKVRSREGTLYTSKPSKEPREMCARPPIADTGPAARPQGSHRHLVHVTPPHRSLARRDDPRPDSTRDPAEHEMGDRSRQWCGLPRRRRDGPVVARGVWQVRGVEPVAC